MKVRVQVRSFEVMCLMISHGLGIGILPERALQPLAKAMGIRLVRARQKPGPKREYAICVRSFDELEVAEQPAYRFPDRAKRRFAAPARGSRAVGRGRQRFGGNK